VDHQSFFAGPVAAKPKRFYYRHGPIGTAAVAPSSFAKRFCRGRAVSFIIEFFSDRDAALCNGFLFLHQASGKSSCLEKASHFLDELKKSRAPGFEEYAGVIHLTGSRGASLPAGVLLPPHLVLESI